MTTMLKAKQMTKAKRDRLTKAASKTLIAIDDLEAIVDSLPPAEASTVRNAIAVLAVGANLVIEAEGSGSGLEGNGK